MQNKEPPPHLPPIILFVGFFLVSGCCLWSGTLFFFYQGSMVYGVISGVCLGATYSFVRQIKVQFFSGARKKNDV